jgi:formylglycine-generating enzyme required for sulfatase activity
MGSNKTRSLRPIQKPPVDLQAYEDEIPPHQIDLPTYYMSRYPVTVAQFKAFVLDTKANVSERDIIPGFPNHPVVLVSFADALAYCTWLTEKLRTWPGTPARLSALLAGQDNPTGRYRLTLPDEAEWEKAARGPEGLIFPWGDEIDSNRANCEDTGIARTSPVGAFVSGVSPYGLEELSGNVWEWTRSLWGRNPATPEFRYPYDRYDGRNDPEAPHEILRVVRGGSFDSGPWNIRSAVRIGLLPVAKTRTVGFRLALTSLMS